jgi:transcriptional regulator with XRE-family HTH domain
VSASNKALQPVIYQSYAHWDTKCPPLPYRSRLFHQEPFGIGTPEVESFTSYIGRIAAEHSVSPRKLLLEEVFAPIGKRSAYYSSSQSFLGNLINGFSGLAKITVTAFEKLTLRHDIQYTTLLMWENILSLHQLLRTNMAWCGACYEERLREKKPVYEKLMWAFEAVSSCPVHHEQLTTTCPHCDHKLPFLATSYRPGYCSKCLRWLGTLANRGAKTLVKKSIPISDLAQELQTSHLLGELLSCTTKFSLPPVNQTFIANLTKHVTQDASRSINLFSDIVGVWSGTIRRLLAGETRLRLPVLLQLCARLNIRPLDLLADQGTEKIIGTRYLILGQDVPLQKELTLWGEVEVRLRAALQESIPPSMEAISRRMGRHPPTVKGHFPELCEQIISRYREYINGRHPPPKEVKRALRAALKEDPPPSLQRVFRRLGCRDTGYYYYSNYSDLCFAVAQRYLNHRNNPFDRDLDRERLLDALAEEPPPSFSEVAKRFRHNREFVRRKFPELSKAVTVRHLNYQSVLRKNKAERLRRVIREAAEQIVTAGLYVSEARVKEYAKHHLPNLGRGSLFKQALREIKLEMGLTSQ